MRACYLISIAAPLCAIPPQAAGQGTLEDYRRAAAVERRLEGLTVGVADAPTWIGQTNRFWYRRSVRGGFEFVVVDAATQQKQPPPFDHDRIAAALSSATGERYTARTLPFRTFDYVNGETAIEADAGDSRWRCVLSDSVCTRLGEARGAGGRGRSGSPGDDAQDEPRVSPDGSTEAFIQNYNVAVRPARRGRADRPTARPPDRRVGGSSAPAPPPYTMLSYDGSEGDSYQLGSIQWSPDSKKLVAYRRRPGYRRVVYFVLSSPSDQLQPKLDSMYYRKPGDVLDTNRPVLFDVVAGRQTIIDNALFPNAYQISSAEWRSDSRAFTFEYNQRGHQVYRIIEVPAETGKPRVVISEEVPTFFNYRPILPNATDAGKKFRFDIAEGREIIWMSERDGWNHLYLYNGVTGRVKNQITKGKWVVRAVDSVDVTNRQIWFQASGMHTGQDPYFVHHYRINFDGTGLVAYTEADGNHTVVWSPDRQYYLDRYSRVDLPAVLELRRGSDRRVLAQVEAGDMSAQLAAAWRPPEVFVAKGRDGVTDIWGVIVRPTNFDSTKKWAVIENIYAGPQGSFVPKNWNPVTGMQALAELGFVVVQIDGMGTSNRSKAFHDVAWKNLGDAGFPDRILWHKAVAAKYPWYDLTRVGITGGSAGGQNATGGVLFHGDFYKVAVSRAGCHDNRMDKIWWNEHWMGWPLAPHYEASSNVVHAGRLTGRLLLAVGEHDTNVDPSSTMQLVNALIGAGKYFDLYVQPGGGHGVGGQLGRRRDDFFVKWLLGVEPPDWNRGVSLQADEAAGESRGYGSSGLEPPPGFYERPDDVPRYHWW
jgi:dipeptidyl aminopeptidase/acylaminoacyl peptidase